MVGTVFLNPLDGTVSYGWNSKALWIGQYSKHERDSKTLWIGHYSKTLQMGH